MWKLSAEENDKRSYINSTTGSKCTTSKVYQDREGNDWYSFDDLMTIPYTRSFAATKISSLYTLGLTKDDIDKHVSGLKTLLKSTDAEKYEKAFALVLDFESKANNAADTLKQLSSLVCVYNMLNDEAIDSFEGSLQLKKMSLLENDPAAHSFFLSRMMTTTEDYMQRLAKLSPIALPGGKRAIGSFSLEVQHAADSERSMMLMQRSITGGILSERDRLLEYSIGEFYTELSLFLQEVETKNKELEKLNKK